MPTASKALFLEKVRQSNAACQSGDFATSVALYTDALSLDPTNHILYSNRSAALVKMGRFEQALQDAIRARELNGQWPKVRPAAADSETSPTADKRLRFQAYYRQGVALQCLGRHGEALAAFSSGLAQDSSNAQLLAGLIEAAMKSPLRSKSTSESDRDGTSDLKSYHYHQTTPRPSFRTRYRSILIYLFR